MREGYTQVTIVAKDSEKTVFMTFTADNQPAPEKKKRGKSFKNKILDVIREEGMILATSDMTREEAEKVYLTHFAKRAFDIDDQASGTLSQVLINKSYPSLKPTLPTVNFDLPDNATPLQKAEAILKAVSEGHISPDIGVMLIQASKYTIDIELATHIKERLDAIEESMGLNV